MYSTTITNERAIQTPLATPSTHAWSMLGVQPLARLPHPIPDQVDAQRHELREAAARACDVEQQLKLEVVRLGAIHATSGQERIALMKTITDIRAEIDDAIGARADAESALTRVRNQKVEEMADASRALGELRAQAAKDKAQVAAQLAQANGQLEAEKAGAASRREQDLQQKINEQKAILQSKQSAIESPSLIRKTFQMRSIRSDIHEQGVAGTLDNTTLTEAATGMSAAEGAVDAMHEVKRALQGGVDQPPQSTEKAKDEAGGQDRAESGAGEVEGQSEGESAGALGALHEPVQEGEEEEELPVLSEPYPDGAMPSIAMGQLEEEGSTAEQRQEYSMKMQGLVKCIEVSHSVCP